jgi:hypothetical protein
MGYDTNVCRRRFGLARASKNPEATISLDDLQAVKEEIGTGTALVAHCSHG